jgi:nucleoid DNA-binding protein
VDITAFIRELLFGHDCVIVPGFGGFIGNYTPARIDKSTSTFYPPVKQISFNRNLNHNDGLLAGRISGSSAVSYNDACKIIDEFVSSIRRRLERGEKVALDNIGSFTNNQEGNVQFEPDRNVNYHLDSYGLESFKFSPLEGYDVRKRITRHIDKESVRSSSMRKIMWRAAVIIPLLALMVAVPLKMNLFKPKLETTSLNPLSTAEFENNKKAVDKSTPFSQAKTDEVAIQPSDDPQSSDVPVSGTARPVPVVTDGYYLIVGSFKQRENADLQVNILKDNGFSPEIIPGPNGYFRVSAIKCSDMATALSRKSDIIRKFPGTWVKRI